jgi:hypothetical protein
MTADTGKDSMSAWCGAAALGLATLFVICAVAAVAFAYTHAAVADFMSYWAAGRLAVQGQASAAYDIARHGAVEAQVAKGVGILPFSYPPPFLLFLLPFAVFPFWLAFAAWVAITAALYVIVTRRLIDVRFSLAQAGAAANFITGQNGFLTSAIFIGGSNLLAARPFIGGIILGFLIFKPQLAILLPVALIAGREWRAICGGIVSSASLSALSLLLFGSEAYLAFLNILPQFSHWLSAGRWPWGELASTFATLLALGVPKTAAMVIHCMIAIAGAALTARAWALKLEQRVPILAAATLLVSPYLFTYDSLLLTPALAWLLRYERRNWTFLAVWLFALLPVVAYVTPFPNTIPLASMLALWALHDRRLAVNTHRVSGGTSYQV